MAFRCGAKQGTIRFHRRLASCLPLQPEGQAHFQEEQTGRDEKYALHSPLLQQDPAKEIGERSSRCPDDIINADQTLQTNRRFALAHQRFQGRPGQAHADVGHDHDRNGGRQSSSWLPIRITAPIKAVPHRTAVK